MSSKKVIKFKIIDYEELLQYISSLSKDFNCSFDMSIFKKYSVIKSYNSNFSQIFLLSNKNISNIILSNLKIYSAGISILKILNNLVVPQLPLGDLMIKYCKNKLILPEPILMKILYGKCVEVREKYKFKYGLLVSKNDEFLGFIKIIQYKNGSKIIPEKDIGWYLRESG